MNILQWKSIKSEESQGKKTTSTMEEGIETKEPNLYLVFWCINLQSALKNYPFLFFLWIIVFF